MNDNLTPLFIFSLPRSGSTLLQRMLAVHEEIATVAESHLLLPYFYTLRNKGVYSEYYHTFTARGIRDFCLELPGGIEDYLSEIRVLALRLYARAAKGQVTYFLDKAGAYHLIVEDIIRLFPDGKFIFLWRNPLAVAASLIKSWSDGKWNLYLYEKRLFQGLPQLVTAYEKYASQAYAIRYEELLNNPQEVLLGIFDYLQLSPNLEAIQRFMDIQFKGSTGDQIGMKQYQVLDREPLEKWKRILANPLRKAWCRHYLQYIGKERLVTMGYDVDELVTSLDAIPFSLQFFGSDMLRMPYGYAARIFELQILRDKLRALFARQKVYMHY